MVDLAEYRGRRGDRIRVIAFDDLEVVSVEVAIRTAAGAWVDTGAAVDVQRVWIFTTTSDAPAGEPLVVTAAAKDRPGNVGVLSVAK